MTPMPPRPLLAAALLAVAALIAGCGGLMPTRESPYRLVDADALATPSAATPWQWVDVRTAVPQDNVSTPAGLVFGDAILQPRPFDYIRAEFARAVAAHESAGDITRRLSGKTLRLETFEASVGLWNRLSERQDGRWEFVRVRLVVSLDGQRYEAADVHRFDNGEKPSPVSRPARAALDNLVRQLHLF